MQYLEILKLSGLFKGIGDDSLETMLACIGAKVKNIRKGKVILHTGDKPTYVGIVIIGQIYILQDDYDGKRSLMASLEKGEIFAEALCCADIEQSPVTVAANTDATVALLRFSRILQTCTNSCSFHTKLIGNMLGIIANKNLQMRSRMEILSIKSIRGKMLYYLETLALKQGSDITIPFNREEMADFLGVERSALSHELARMKKDGLIEYKKNNFTLKI